MSEHFVQVTGVDERAVISKASELISPPPIRAIRPVVPLVKVDLRTFRRVQIQVVGKRLEAVSLLQLRREVSLDVHPPQEELIVHLVCHADLSFLQQASFDPVASVLHFGAAYGAGLDLAHGSLAVYLELRAALAASGVPLLVLSDLRQEQVAVIEHLPVAVFREIRGQFRVHGEVLLPQRLLIVPAPAAFLPALVLTQPGDRSEDAVAHIAFVLRDDRLDRRHRLVGANRMVRHELRRVFP